MPDFHFNVPADGKITFEISYAPGVLLEVRAKMTRAEKAAAKEAEKAAAEQKNTPEENTPAVTETPDAIPEQKETALAIIPEAPATKPEKTEDTATENEAAEESTIAANEPVKEAAPAEESGIMEISYNVTLDDEKTGHGYYFQANRSQRMIHPFSLPSLRYMYNKRHKNCTMKFISFFGLKTVDKFH